MRGRPTGVGCPLLTLSNRNSRVANDGARLPEVFAATKLEGIVAGLVISLLREPTDGPGWTRMYRSRRNSPHGYRSISRPVKSIPTPAHRVAGKHVIGLNPDGAQAVRVVRVHRRL